MIITVNVNVTGLESLVSVLERLASFAPAAAQVAATQAPTPAPAQVPAAAPAHLSVVPPVQPTSPAPIMTATAPALSVMQQPAPVMQAAPAPQAVPTAVQSYTMDQLAVAGTQLIDAGRMAELQSLLASFGVQALTQLPKEQYGNFATQLRAMGAKI